MLNSFVDTLNFAEPVCIVCIHTTLSIPSLSNIFDLGIFEYIDQVSCNMAVVSKSKSQKDMIQDLSIYTGFCQ